MQTDQNSSILLKSKKELSDWLKNIMSLSPIDYIGMPEADSLAQRNRDKSFNCGAGCADLPSLLDRIYHYKSCELRFWAQDESVYYVIVENLNFITDRTLMNQSKNFQGPVKVTSLSKSLDLSNITLQC